MDFKSLVKKVKRYNDKVDIALLEKSYNFCEEIFSEDERESGELYIDHHLEVAHEVANLKLDDNSIAAALIHVALERVSFSDIEKKFGKDIANIVKNIKKMSDIKKSVSRKTIDPEDLRKVLLAASKDLRALLVKICDQYVNLKNLIYFPVVERKVIAKEVMDIYSPLAYRLGLGKLKTEMEDLGFRFSNEKKYLEIEDTVSKIRKEGEKSIYIIKRNVEKCLKKEKINNKVQFRVKNNYSIYRKIVEKNYHPKNLMDIVAIRIIVDSNDDCYKALKIVHENFRPVPNKFKDYIAVPKPNGYRSLHTSVVDKEGRLFEVQIRTQEMHDIAEEGVASHFSYKKVSHGSGFDKKLGWLKELISGGESGGFDVSFFGDEIFVFSPKGKMVELPKNSCVLDFAYQIHSDLGSRCIGARVNGKFVSLKESVKNGDVVDVLTLKTQKPSREWLKYSKTSKAREKIKQFLKSIGKVPTRNYGVIKKAKKDVGESLLDFEGNKKIIVKLALCCKPIPGDKVIGIKTSNARMMVHKMNCKEVLETKKKITKVKWMKKFTKPVKIVVDAKDRGGLMKEILNNISKLKIEVSKAKGKITNNDNLEFSFRADVQELSKLNDLIKRIKKIKDVHAVYVNV